MVVADLGRGARENPTKRWWPRGVDGLRFRPRGGHCARRALFWFLWSMVFCRSTAASSFRSIPSFTAISARLEATFDPLLGRLEGGGVTEEFLVLRHEPDGSLLVDRESTVELAIELLLLPHPRFAHCLARNRSQSGITGIRQPRPLVDSLARGRGSLGHREPPRNRMSGSPAHSAPAGGRWLPPSASAPRTGSPPRYRFPR